MRTLRNEAFSRTGLPLGKFKNLSTLVSRRVSSALKKKANKKKERCRYENETERPNHAARPGLARPIAPSLRKDEQKRRHVVLQSNANVPRVTPGRDRRSGRARGREHL
jgi:hypothetical protein